MLVKNLHANGLMRLAVNKPYLSCLVEYNDIAQIVVDVIAPMSQYILIGIQQFFGGFASAHLLVESLHLCGRQLHKLLLISVIYREQVALFSEQHPTIRQGITDADVVVVQQTQVT